MKIIILFSLKKLKYEWIWVGGNSNGWLRFVKEKQQQQQLLTDKYLFFILNSQEKQQQQNNAN